MSDPHFTPLSAAAPERHATVHASAGTGKTWLLVTRIVRLLLSGAAPAAILAVTFTRKAAAEMLERLTERLAMLAGADDATVDATLRTLGLQPDLALRRRARHLYEELLFDPQPLRATTFHAFCQELLQRFPLEAEIPPGFDLLESEAELIDEAWDALYAEATQTPDGRLARALEQLFDACDGLGSTRQALNSFVAHRIDWWAYTQQSADPLAHAAAAARTLFDVDPDTDPSTGFFATARLADLREYAVLLGKHDNQTHRQQQSVLLQALDLHAVGADDQRDACLAQITTVLLTGDGEPRKRSASKALEKSLGVAGSARLLELHRQLCDAMLELRDAQARRQSFSVTCAWHRAGQRLLEHYQRIKREQRLLDFSDLEWNAYRLLNSSEQAHWVQYKLDARIDHILIDEFQDTNPTQWRLLLPLLEELAAGADERPRSVFLVGDTKQSIYRFRRADARLLDSASVWLEEHLYARRYSLEASRRSSPAIIDCVNRAFAAGPLAERLPEFPAHSTHRADLWGRVELLPPVPSLETATPPARTTLRNPLLEPRGGTQDSLHEHEARLIAARIRTLVDAPTVIGVEHDARPLRYGDILLLLRNRTHAASYEKALREAGIPYLGAARGTLLESLEVRDLEALLNTLVTAHDNLALAQVLRSPLFAAADADLIALAQTTGTNWMERLLTVGAAAAIGTPLARAADLLPRWQMLVGRLPVHDLLDRIYHEGDVLARFHAASPPALQPRVRANLTRFIELALEIDSGRYPSLPHFVNQLRALRERAHDAPDDAPPESGAGNRVRFLTVHGAKGLEAPAVFLADCGGGERDRNAWQALVDWPAQHERPAHFVLIGRKESRDSVTQRLLAAQRDAEAREDANLLYVALTRARQLLFVSAAVTAEAADSGWYGLLRAQWAVEGKPAVDATWIHTHGTPPAAAQAEVCRLSPTPAIDPRLAQPLTIAPVHKRIAPSRAANSPLDTVAVGDPDGRQRGIGIHRLLEWLTSPPTRTPAQLLAGLARELQRDPADPELLQWLTEAAAVVHDPSLAAVFDASRYQRVYVEVPVHYLDDDGALVDGVIDRLLVDAADAHIVDYKTHDVDAAHATALAAKYREQLRLYAAGVQRLWPQQRIRASILFTHCRTLIELEL